MNEVTQRFIESYKYLEKEKYFPHKKKFAEIIGISNSLLTDIEKGRSNIGVTAIRNIVTEFNISADWLLNGTGKMIHDQLDYKTPPEHPPEVFCEPKQEYNNNVSNVDFYIKKLLTIIDICNNLFISVVCLYMLLCIQHLLL